MSRKAIELIVKRHIESIKAGVPSTGHALLMGPSGCGKTYTIEKALQDYDNIPVITLDASMLTREGWSGMSLSDVMLDAYKEHQENLEHAIVYVDEFDKINRNSDTQGHSKGVQYNFLKYLDGGHITLSPQRGATETLRTDNMTFVFSGAFTEFREQKDTSIGFTKEESVHLSLDIHEQLVKAGFIKELAYRIPYVIDIPPYTREELQDILKNHFGLAKMRILHSVEIDLDELLDFVTKHPAGARAIQIYLSQQDLKQFYRKVKDDAEQAESDNELET